VPVGSALRFAKYVKYVKYVEKRLISIKKTTCRDLQPHVDRVAQNLEIISKISIFVLGIPGFSWDFRIVSSEYPIPFENPMGRILVDDKMKFR